MKRLLSIGVTVIALLSACNNDSDSAKSTNDTAVHAASGDHITATTPPATDNKNSQATSTTSASFMDMMNKNMQE